jgi:hypothetical protein
MHRAVIWAEPVYQPLDIELGRFAAHRMPAIDVQRFIGGKGLFWHGELRMKGIAVTRHIFLVLMPLARVLAGGLAKVRQTAA